MKNVVVTAYVGFRNPSNHNVLRNVLGNQLGRLGYRIRLLRVGDYSRSTNPPINSYLNYALRNDYSTFVTLFLSVPNNATVNTVKNNFISVLRTFGNVTASYGQLGESIASVQDGSEPEIAVDENSVAVDEVGESTSEVPSGGALIVGLGLGALATYLITK